MALSTHKGGAADKAGLYYEAIWGVHAMLLVLDGKASSIRIETPGDDGAEFQLERDNTLEHWQAKRQVTGQDTWSLQKLRSEGVLKFFSEKHRDGERCVFASISDAPDLRMLTENAVAANSLGEFKKHFLEKRRSKQFKDLGDHIVAKSEAEIFSFLRSVRVEGGREITLELLLARNLEASFNARSEATMAALRDLFLQSSHETLRAEDIERHLAKCEISRRKTALSERDRIVDVTSTYIAGQRMKLIRGKLLPREEGEKIVSDIENSSEPLDMLITGAAGSGKSGCMLQIVEGLQAKGIPVLGFRLDRVEPLPTTIQLGAHLGFSESPALVLADTFPGKSVVLIIDQVDCVSTTSGRHPDFFDTLAALRNEVTGLRSRSTIHLILACRKFDLDHDYRLKQLTDRDDTVLSLANFSAEDTAKIIGNEGGNYSKLTQSQQSMLTLPQNLAMYVEARLYDSENRFTTTKELCDEYWNAKRRVVAAKGDSFSQLWLQIVEHLTTVMSERQELSVPVRVMDEFPPDILDLMASEGVLTVDGKRYGFGHESLFDYCFARIQLNSDQDFISFLESDAQHLFRRSQLRQVLAFLRDEDFEAYLDTVNRAIRSKLIRPHLKLLVVNLVVAHPEPRDEELLLLVPWIECEIERRRHIENAPETPLGRQWLSIINTSRKKYDSLEGKDIEGFGKLASRIWDGFFHSNTMFASADRVGLISSWINSDYSWLQDTVVLYLRRHTEEHAERVAELLEPFVGNSDWQKRFRYLMEGRNLEKSRRFFDLFLTLLNEGVLDDAKDRFAVNGTFWSMLHGLAEQRPSWCAELAARWLDRKVKLESSRPNGVQERSILDDNFGVDDLFTSARGDSKAFLTHIIPSLLNAASTFVLEGDEDRFRMDRIWAFRMRTEHISMSEAYLSACETALEELGKASPGCLRPFVDQLSGPRLYIANQLLLNAYLAAPLHFSDEALLLVASDPQRLNSGYSDSPYWFARQIVEKCSPHCSDNTFVAVEAALLAYVSPFERSREGFRRRGYSAYNLSAALIASRTSKDAKAQIRQWATKFGTPDGPPKGIVGGWVGPPIEPESAERMTDEQWLGALTKYDSEERAYDFDDPTRGGALELARMLEEFTKKEPGRFANLALRFPESTHPHYFSHVLRGIVEAEIDFDLKLTVARRLFSVDHRDCIHAVLNVLGSAPDADLAGDAISFIRNAAQNPDPQDDSGGFGCILTNGINSVRGYVAEAIRSLLFEDSHYLDVFADEIHRLVNDPTLAVRSVAASTLHPVINHDRPQALWWFLELINTDDRILGVRFVQDFVRYNLGQNLDEISHVIERMLNSTLEDIRNKGGTLAGLARLYHDEAETLCESALEGDESCRRGVGEVAKSNLLNPHCRGWCEQVLSGMFHDESEGVRKLAANCFWHLWKSPEIPLSDYNAIIQSFVSSPAFADEPTYILYALSETRHKVPDAALDVCEAFVAQCGEQAADMRTSYAHDEHIMGKLVFSTIAQLNQESQQIRALNVIDQMSLEGLASVGGHLAEVER